MANTCSECAFWQHNPTLRAAPNVQSPGGGGAVAISLRVGNCFESPPVMHLMPVQTLQGNAIAPQPLRPMTIENEAACRHFRLREKAEVKQIQGS